MDQLAVWPLTEMVTCPQGRANRRELYALPEISGFFDDEKHFEEIK